MYNCELSMISVIMYIVDIKKDTFVVYFISYIGIEVLIVTFARKFYSFNKCIQLLYLI